MHLEHLNLVVSDLQQTLAFYQAAMPHWSIRGRGEGLWHGVQRQWVHFGDDYHYLSFNDNGTGQIRDVKSHDLGLGHFAYVVSDIDSLVNRMTLAGFNIAINGATDESHKSVYYIDPNGYEVEFLQYFSDIPSERNKYTD
ncbi:VOC family protein [Shewanella intestini]|uniref:VOC family protein n=1 Tax=Shewanella intestini TaxID=2017544 RepID=A0ABS5HZ63_9GAMM|nr:MULTISPECIES: VOC family protein [Shewanella]MBR9727069.1 VOC family protein [Shewanella intestini]MRG35871.1 VOC family protein [Shewanella sp. XMDDZSB0408]